MIKSSTKIAVKMGCKLEAFEKKNSNFQTRKVGLKGNFQKKQPSVHQTQSKKKCKINLVGHILF